MRSYRLTAIPQAASTIFFQGMQTLPNTETRETQENEASSCLGGNREAKSLALIPHRMWRCSGAISTRMCIAASGTDRSRAPPHVSRMRRCSRDICTRMSWYLLVERTSIYFSRMGGCSRPIMHIRVLMGRNHLHILVECGGGLDPKVPDAPMRILALRCRDHLHILVECEGGLDP